MNSIKKCINKLLETKQAKWLICGESVASVFGKENNEVIRISTDTTFATNSCKMTVESTIAGTRHAFKTKDETLASFLWTLHLDSIKEPDNYHASVCMENYINNFGGE